MCNDGLEILDADNDVKLLFDYKLTKLQRIHGDGSVKRLLQYL